MRSEAERKAAYDAQIAHATEVVSHLAGWTMDVQPSSTGVIDAYGTIQAVNTELDAHIVFELDEWKKRLCIYGLWPNHDDRSPFAFHSDEDRQHYRNDITVNPEKDPAKIARDITNRLLPTYLKGLDVAKRIIGKADEQKRRRLALSAAIARHYGQEHIEGHPGCRSYGRMYSNGVEVEVQTADAVHVKVRLEGKQTAILNTIKAIEATLESHKTSPAAR